MVKKKGGAAKSQPNDRGPAGNTAPTTTTMSVEAAQQARAGGGSGGGSLASSVRNVGPVLSKKEAIAIAEDTGKTVAQVFAKAQEKGVGLGAGAVNAFSNGKLGPNNGAMVALGGYNQGTARALEALAPLQNLQLGKGTAYYGASQYNTPAAWSNNPDSGSSYTPGSTVYNPIVLPRGAYGGATAGGGAAGGAGGGGAGGGGGGGGNGRNGRGGRGTKNNGTFDSIKELYAQQMADGNAQIEKYAQMQAEQINTMQLGFGNTIAEIQSAADQRVNQLSDLMLMQQQQSQQTQDLLKQQAQAAERAYAEQARVASALGTAYVPTPEASAASVALGDQRTTQRQQTNLSDLAIVSGLGTNSNPLAGLQLA